MLPVKRPHPRGGRPWIEDRTVLGGIIYVLRARVPWRLLPARFAATGAHGGRRASDHRAAQLGRHRWKVERSLAWLLAYRRLTVRYERRAEILQAFLHLACALACAGRLPPL